MATITKEGRALANELSRKTGAGLFHPAEVSLLLRRAKRYARLQEHRCNGDRPEEWLDKAEARLELKIKSQAETLPGAPKVLFTGDPRGYAVRLLLKDARGNALYNTWGGPEDGFGIA